ncbi:unnamed protein product [Lactuca virosa]|uniref:Uncharacterized protein n=1 Tax=Lactuca virosa TaxID=75947 RepID=A0AAU9M609_9ASTR|nr:unnamed protein product [Lactuca virosa]
MKSMVRKVVDAFNGTRLKALLGDEHEDRMDVDIVSGHAMEGEKADEEMNQMLTEVTKTMGKDLLSVEKHNSVMNGDGTTNAKLRMESMSPKILKPPRMCNSKGQVEDQCGLNDKYVGMEVVVYNGNSDELKYSKGIDVKVYVVVKKTKEVKQEGQQGICMGNKRRFRVHLEDARTIAKNINIHANVIECWSVLLNKLEESFFPIVEGNYYLICFNLRSFSILIIDHKRVVGTVDLSEEGEDTDEKECGDVEQEVSGIQPSG